MLFYLRTTNETIPTNVIKMRKSRKFLSFTLRHWIPDPGVPDSKPLGGYKVRSAYHTSEVENMSTRNFWGLSGKKYLYVVAL